MKKYTLECCVDSVESACIAANNGADRLELCGNLVIGGTSPSIALFEQIRKKTDVRIHVLLRSRFGDFLYTEDEFAILEREVALFRDAGAEGVVIGCLLPNGNLDIPRMKRLMELAGDMSVTLHRAFDVCVDPFQALKEAKDLGVHTILTSGQKNNCLAGAELLQELDKESGSVDIMAGAGVDANAIKSLLQTTSLTSFHMSGKEVLESGMQYRKDGVNMGIPGLSEFEIWRTDGERIAAARDVLAAKMV